MSWRIQIISNPPQFDDEVKAFAKNLALTEALKQEVDFYDDTPDWIDRLGQKWRNHCLELRRKIGNCSDEQFEHLLILAWRVNRFAHHYEAALIRRTLELSGKEPSELEKQLSIAKGCQQHYLCGVLVAQHYTTIIGAKEMLQGTCLTGFPGTGKILEALSFDCAMQAALCLPENIEKALDWLADSVAANDLALQGALQLGNFFNRKAELATNGKAGAQIRHAKTRELKEWTLQKYKAKTWKSANQAASELTSEVLAYSQKIGANLSQSNAQRTIAEWIRKSA